jgi:antitoxin component YwqK of YwqJK toxin-antitoxin module
MTKICNWKDLVSVFVYGKGNDIFYTKFTEDRFTGDVVGQCQGTLKNGMKEGYWVEYHHNGRLFQKGTYKHGKKVGIPWVEYTEYGDIKDTERSANPFFGG